MVTIICLIIFVITLVILQVADSKYFGEFKGKFKADWVCQLYIFVTVIYRCVLGFFMAINNEDTYVTLFVLAFSLAFIMYNIINLPFNDSFHNYRANLCHITQLVILLVTNYYRSMRLNDKI